LSHSPIQGDLMEDSEKVFRVFILTPDEKVEIYEGSCLAVSKIKSSLQFIETVAASEIDGLIEDGEKQNQFIQ
jgi:hypothetical protein